MSCQADHDSFKSSLATFALATRFVAVQVFAGGVESPEVQYMGNCPVCGSTLAVVIDLARGHAVKGEIVTGDTPREPNRSFTSPDDADYDDVADLIR